MPVDDQGDVVVATKFCRFYPQSDWCRRTPAASGAAGRANVELSRASSYFKA